MKYGIIKWSGGEGIIVEADSEREAREIAKAWIGDDGVLIRAMSDYEPPPPSRSSIPPSVSACLAKAREHTRSVDAILGGVKLPARRAL